MVEIDLVAAQTDRLADAQAMAKHRQKQQVIADAMTPGLGGIEQDSDFTVAQEILAALMGIRGDGRRAFYISPPESRCRHHQSPADFRLRHRSTLYRMRLL